MSQCIFIFAFWIASILSLQGQDISQTQAQPPAEEEVEMLDVFEVPGTAIQPEKRQLLFPRPAIDSLDPLSEQDLFDIHVAIQLDRPDPQRPKILDPIGKIRGIRTSVKPSKAPRPPYPRFAREQGWEGTTVLRVAINNQGTVSSATTQQSSGFPMLDDNAIEAVKQWEFAPAKNGEFAVASVVDIPIRFDLDQSQ